MNDEIFDSAAPDPQDKIWLEHGKQMLAESLANVRNAANGLVIALGVLEGIYLGILGFAKFIMIEPVETFKALGDETRLRLVNLLLQTDKEICVCEMVDALELPQYQISKHLTILKNAGHLQASRKGTWVYYRLDYEASPFLHDLLIMLGRHLKQQTFSDDAAKLAQRLALRQNGQCVVGFVSATAITKGFQPKKAGKKYESKTARHLHLHA